VAYTEEQVARGKRTYSDQCASCHGGSLEGATGGALAGSGSSPHSIGDMAARIKAMPLTAPGSLTSQQYADISAYILKSNCHPSNGKGEMTAEIAADVIDLPVMRGKCS
jgi:mono/diheme cytochrome c family protein